MKITLAIVLLTLSLFAYSQQISEQFSAAEGKNFIQLQQYERFSVASNNYDALYYNCDWTVDPAVRYIGGSVAMHFAMLTNSSSLTLDLHKELVVDSIIFQGKSINYVHLGEQSLQVNFPQAMASGQKDSMRIYYHGVPTTTGFGSFILSTHSGTPVLWTLSEPYGAPTWWPCKDSNRDKPDSISITLQIPSTMSSM